MAVSPIQYFEIKGQVYPLLSKTLNAAAGNNNEVIPASSGNIHRIMGLSTARSGAGGVGIQDFKSNNAARVQTLYLESQKNTILFPITDSGYFETVVSESLTVDLGSDGYINVYYITYKP
jgi:hypothetical protein